MFKISSTALIALILLPMTTLAQESTLVSDGLGLRSDNLDGYVNNLIELVILFGGVLAVLIIATAALQYMTSDAVSGKTAGKERIRQAVFGLVMLLAVWIFFNEINPEILKLDFQLDAVKATGREVDTNLQAQQRTLTNREVTSTQNGQTYTSSVWTPLSNNQTCENSRGTPWVMVSAQLCPGPQPTSAHRCCGKPDS